MTNRIDDVLDPTGLDAVDLHGTCATPIGRLLAVALILLLAVVQAPPTRADLTVNVDQRVEVSFSNWSVGQTVKTYSTEATVKNTSDSPIPVPIRLVISNIEKKNTSVTNADGVTSGGRPFFEMDVPGGVLAPGESSLSAVIEFRRRAGNSPAAAPGKGKGKGLGRTKHRNFPTFEFGHSVLGGSSVALSAPSSNPFALAAGAGPVDVAFSVSAVTEGDAYDGDVLLQGPDLGAGLPMSDGDGDGIFTAATAVSAVALAGGDCLSYTATTVSGDGAEIESPVYDLCATAFRIGIGESDTTPGNQVPVGGGTAVGDELLVFVEPGTSESVIETVSKRFGSEVIGTLLPQGMYQIRLGGTLTEEEFLELIEEINRVDGVTSSGPNFIGTFTGAPNDPDFAGMQHALQLVSSDDPTLVSPRYVWDAGATGSGITVLVLDSGIDEIHPDLVVLPENSPGDNTDTLGHGTEMAGIIGATTDNATGIAAMARDAQLQSIKVSADSSVTQAEMLSGFTTALPLAGPNAVVNASFSIIGPLLPAANLCSSIDDLISAGSVVINSAGNDNNSTTGVWPGMCNDPLLNGLLAPNVIADANKPSFIVVGASNCNSGACASDSKKSDSNFGSWVDIAAPGVGIRTTTIPGVYTGSDGTSAAAALTSGGAAVLRSCGVATTSVFSQLNAGATVVVTTDFNRISLYDSLAPLNSAPTGIGLTSPVSSIDEFVDTTGGFSVGDLTTTDATVCDAHSYSISGGADAASFSVGSDNALLLDDGVLDYEVKASYQVEVTSTDFYGSTTTQLFTVNVNDLPEPVITELVSCGTDNTNGDQLFRGFYHPSYPGSTIDEVELFISADVAGDYEVQLEVRENTYDGALIASDSQTRTVPGGRLNNVSYVFELGNALVSSTGVTFKLSLLSGPDTFMFYAVDAAAHPFDDVDNPGDPCDVNQTEGTTPPLDDLRRNGIWIRIDGEP